MGVRFPRTAKVAKYIAFGVVPVCWLIGTILAEGQDAAGAGMISGIMILLGIGIAIVAGIVYVIARFGIRLPRVSPATVKHNWGRLLITIALFGGLFAALAVMTPAAPQSYSLWVSHEYDADITRVTVILGEERRSFERIPAKMFSVSHDLNSRPGSVEVSWEDPAGASHTAALHVAGSVPDKYHNGQVRVAIVSADDVRASFRFPR